MTVKRGENNKLIAKLQRKLEAREKEIAKLKAGRKADKKQIKNLQRENNKKRQDGNSDKEPKQITFRTIRGFKFK
ncbi:hypothetical protein [Hallella mizrahii]|uniref:Uncharacterized protein n=1 Tax=Hallella mizrahii TaxID=2606637 RepID=A0A7K0KD23_9BACT|nr:hypothetical protein [Hallella mizrahii]MST83831.1 hypothetical protein [Hallella mizrahii]